jgi:hypothetical protein
MTRASAVVSTSAPTMIRSPAPRTISIRPTGSDVTAATLDTGSVVIVTGTSCGLSRLSAILAAPCCRRQVNRRLALTPWCRATSATEAPGSKLSAIIRRLRSIDQACRRRRPCNPSASSPSDICDSVHYHLSGHDHRATPTHYRPSSASARRPSPKGNFEAAPSGGGSVRFGVSVSLTSRSNRRPPNTILKFQRRPEFYLPQCVNRREHNLRCLGCSPAAIFSRARIAKKRETHERLRPSGPRRRRRSDRAKP